MPASTSLAKLKRYEPLQEKIEKERSQFYSAPYEKNVLYYTQAEKNTFIENVLRTSLNNLNRLPHAPVSFEYYTFPFYLLEVLGGYVAHQANIENVPVKIDLEQKFFPEMQTSWKSISLAKEPFEFDNRLYKQINHLMDMKVPTKEGWLFTAKKSLKDIVNSSENKQSKQNQITLALLQLLFKKESSTINRLIDIKKNNDNYDAMSLNIAKKILDELSKKYLSILDKEHKYTPAWGNNDEKIVWQTVKDTIEKSEPNAQLTQFYQDIINNVIPVSEITDEEKFIVDNYLKELKILIKELIEQEEFYQKQYAAREQDKTKGTETKLMIDEERPSVSSAVYQALGIKSQAPAYEILGLKANPSSLPMLRNAFSIMIMKWHPDKNTSPHANEATDLIRWAYQHLRSRMK